EVLDERRRAERGGTAQDFDRRGMLTDATVERAEQHQGFLVVGIELEHFLVAGDRARIFLQRDVDARGEQPRLYLARLQRHERTGLLARLAKLSGAHVELGEL